MLSNGIIFELYNLYYIDQIDDLDRRESLINREGGSIEVCICRCLINSRKETSWLPLFDRCAVPEHVL
jgi:hypothetical protein